MGLMIKTFAAGLALLSLAAAPAGPSAPVTEFFGEISDPAGDAIQWGWEPASKPAPDLVYASVHAADGQLQVTVRFAPGTYAADTMVEFFLDTDADPSTGWPGTTRDMDVDADVLGVDYFFHARGLAFDGAIGLSMFDSSTGDFVLITFDIDVTFHSDGLDISIPLSLIGDDDGRLHFKASTFVQITDAATWPFSDWITDPGLQPGSTVPADEEIADLGDAISDLESDGTLGHGPSQALSNHLENAQRALDEGHVNAARGQLEAFIEKVEDLIADGTLTAEEGEALIATAERLLAGL